MLKCAIVGVTGLVGSTFLKVLEERNLSNLEYSLFASKKSKGKKIIFMDKEYIVKELTEKSFIDEKYDYALFSAGSSVSSKYAPLAAKTGCIVIDNSSAFRMEKDVPLVVPEVNMEDAYNNKGIISNPNCSTIQAVIPINILNKYYTVKRIVYTTFQAVSGAGIKGLEDLKNTALGKKAEKFPYPIYNSCIPQIDIFMENGYTKEEIKMIEETRKILHQPFLNVTATTVRVPVENSHSESINIEFKKEFDIEELKQNLAREESIVVLDEPQKQIYPIASFATSKDDVL